jgi:prepilin-type N-terminal cleavage/methylation domain-containing protein
MKRAFSLLELMIALAMATAIAAAALMASVQIGRVMSDTRRRVIVLDEAKRINEALTTEIQESGGSPLPPHRAVVVDNGTCTAIAGATAEATIPACDGNDRLLLTSVRNTFITSTGAVRSLGTCDVVSVSGAVLQLQADTNGNCSCLFPENPVGRGTVDDEPSPYSRSSVMFVRASDSAIFRLNVKGTVRGCALSVPSGAGNPPSSSLGPGVLVPVTQRLFFTAPDPTLPQARQIRVWSDVAHGTDQPDGVPSIDELSLVADHVYTFQVALGYDAGDDGDLLDRSAIDDEWVGNVPSDTRPGSIADDRLLRMVGVGVVVGERVALTGAPVRVFDGPRIAVPGIYFATATTKIALRNLNISVP